MQLLALPGTQTRRRGGGPLVISSSSLIVGVGFEKANAAAASIVNRSGPKHGGGGRRFPALVYSLCDYLGVFVVLGVAPAVEHETTFAMASITPRRRIVPEQ